jgi:hypothetical protein
VRTQEQIQARIARFESLGASLGRHELLEIARNNEAVRALGFVMGSGLSMSELDKFAGDFECLPEVEARVWADQIRWCLGLNYDSPGFS